jgi:hypothetical protein
MAHLRANRRRFGSAVLVVGLLASLLLIEVQPSGAAVIHNCTVMATKPTVNGSATQVTAHGGITCDNFHVLTLTVQLQIFAGGKWSTTAKKSSSTRHGIGLNLDVPDSCGRFPHDYRSRSVATVDGDKVTEISNLTASC